MKLIGFMTNGTYTGWHKTQSVVISSVVNSKHMVASVITLVSDIVVFVPATIFPPFVLKRDV